MEKDNGIQPFCQPIIPEIEDFAIEALKEPLWFWGAGKNGLTPAYDETECRHHLKIAFIKQLNKAYELGLSSQVHIIDIDKLPERKIHINYDPRDFEENDTDVD